MKLSNKILIAFFGFIFIYLTAVFAEIRLRGTPNIIDDTRSIAETMDISGVEYLVLQNLDHPINVIGSDQARLEIRSLQGELLQSVKYNISGDTLTLSQLPSDIKAIKISVFVHKVRLKGVTVDSAMAIVTGLDRDALYISQNNGRIRISDSRVSKIQIESSGNSQFDVSATGMDTVLANIEESRVVISSPVKHLEGSMQNNSYMQVDDIGEIEVKKDESSKLHMYQ